MSEPKKKNIIIIVFYEKKQSWILSIEEHTSIRSSQIRERERFICTAANKLKIRHCRCCCDLCVFAMKALPAHTTHTHTNTRPLAGIHCRYGYLERSLFIPVFVETWHSFLCTLLLYRNMRIFVRRKFYILTCGGGCTSVCAAHHIHHHKHRVYKTLHDKKFPNEQNKVINTSGNGRAVDIQAHRTFTSEALHTHTAAHIHPHTGIRSHSCTESFPHNFRIHTNTM